MFGKEQREKIPPYGAPGTTVLIHFRSGVKGNSPNPNPDPILTRDVWGGGCSSGQQRCCIDHSTSLDSGLRPPPPTEY